MGQGNPERNGQTRKSGGAVVTEDKRKAEELRIALKRAKAALYPEPPLVLKPADLTATKPA